MRLRYKISLVLIVITLAICLMTFQSYALWIVSLHGTENVINVGCFQIEFQEVDENGVTTTNSSINLQNTYPVPDEKGLETTPYSFKITNKCSVNSHYHVTLNVPNSNTLEDQYIKYAFYEGTNEKPQTGSILSEQNKNEDQNELTDDNLKFPKANLKTSYLFASGILKENDEVTYHLILWMDENADSEQMKKTFQASLNVINDATSLETLTEEQKQVFPNTVIDQQDESGNGLVTQTHEDEMSEEETLESQWTKSELRYVGPNPKNYVEFNDETWRIIGLVNVKTTSGAYEQRLKIIRKDSIGEVNWDSSISDANAGYGVNEWSQADLMKLMNPGFENNKLEGEHGEVLDSFVNNSLYWNGKDGTCYVGGSHVTGSCNFSNTGGLSKSESYIADDIIWSTGAMSGDKYDTEIYGFSKYLYKYERSKNTGWQCDSETWSVECSDSVDRTTEWKSENGKKALVGLMYPSDFGFAIGGGSENRTSCLNTVMYKWNNYDNCYKNDWLLDENNIQWTIMPYSNSDMADLAFCINTEGSVFGTTICSNYHFSAHPVVYLKQNVEIYEGDGSEGNNFKLRIV